MNYSEYLEIAKSSYDNHYTSTKMHPPQTSWFSQVGSFSFDLDKLSSNYMNYIDAFADKCTDFYQGKSGEGLITYPKPYNDDNVKQIANEIVPHLEETLYGCNLYVDKVYAWRTLDNQSRQASWLWHYDNNPREIFKIMIYLHDVDEEHAPLEVLRRKDNTMFGVVMPGTRFGPGKWEYPPNSGRIPDSKIQEYLNNGYETHKYIGPKGHIAVFNNDALHRANIPLKGYHRDCLVIRVKPTVQPVSEYIGKYTTSYESSGVVNPNPEII